MSPLEMIAEWRKGCSCALAGKPELCSECTRGLIDALEKDIGRIESVQRVWVDGKPLSMSAGVTPALSPCPFCKAEEVALQEKSDGGMPGSRYMLAFVQCGKCKARGPQFDDWEDPEYKLKAVDAWNRHP